jgi:hypothetical protein
VSAPSLAASLEAQLLASLVTAIPASILTVAISWQAILRRKVEARVELEFEREKGRFEDRLQRRRELLMRVLETEMLERLDEIMGSAYRARNAARDLAAMGHDDDHRAQLLEHIATEGRTFQQQIMDNRIRLSALSSFDEAHALKNALLAMVRAQRAGQREGLAESAALVESSFERFDAAINKVLAEPDMH